MVGNQELETVGIGESDLGAFIVVLAHRRDAEGGVFNRGDLLIYFSNILAVSED